MLFESRSEVHQIEELSLYTQKLHSQGLFKNYLFNFATKVVHKLSACPSKTDSKGCFPVACEFSVFPRPSSTPGRILNQFQFLVPKWQTVLFYIISLKYYQADSEVLLSESVCCIRFSSPTASIIIVDLSANGPSKKEKRYLTGCLLLYLLA